MNDWKILTLVGPDRPGIVAAITRVLAGADARIGEASMQRMGGLFTLMMMVANVGDTAHLKGLLESVRKTLGLKLHVDEMDAGLHRSLTPDACFSITGVEDAQGLAQVAAALAEAGFNIIEWRAEVAGSAEQAYYRFRVQGQAANGLGAVEAALVSGVPDALLVREACPAG